jgi:hypothetical protein
VPATIEAALNRVSQLGVEVTPGTPVAAHRRLLSMGLPFTKQIAVQSFRPPGFKYTVGHALTRKWSSGSVGDGSAAAYSEIPYLLASLMAKPAIRRTLGSVVAPRTTLLRLGDFYRDAAGTAIYKVTTAGTTAGVEPSADYLAANTVGETVTDGSAVLTNAGVHPSPATEWIFDTSTYDRDDIQTYTVETGNRISGRAYQVAHAFFTGATLSWGRAGEVGIEGALLGEAPVDHVLTAEEDLDESPLIPATPGELNVYMDDDPDEIGTTFLDGNFSGNVALTDKLSHVWFTGRQYNGPAASVESPPDATFELVQADGTEVDDAVAALEAGQQKYFEMDFLGPEIAAGINNRMQFRVCGKINDNVDFDEEQNVYAATIPFEMEHSPDWGRAMQVRVVTALANLT